MFLSDRTQWCVRVQKPTFWGGRQHSVRWGREKRRLLGVGDQITLDFRTDFCDMIPLFQAGSGYYITHPFFIYTCVSVSSGHRVLQHCSTFIYFTTIVALQQRQPRCDSDPGLIPRDATS